MSLRYNCRDYDVCGVDGSVILRVAFDKYSDKIVGGFADLSVHDFFRVPSGYAVELEVDGTLYRYGPTADPWLSMVREYCGRYKVLITIRLATDPYVWSAILDRELVYRHYGRKRLAYDYIDGSCSNYRIFYVVGYTTRNPAPYYYMDLSIDAGIFFRRVS